MIPPRLYRHAQPRGLFTATFDGRPVCQLVSEGHLVENEIFWRGLEGCHEKLSMALWIELCQVLEPRCIWDVGASTGVYGLVAKSVARNAEVSFFEPLVAPRRQLARNLEVNDFQAQVLEVALSNYDGVGSVYLPVGTDFAYSVTVNANLSLNGTCSSHEVQVRRADSLIGDGVVTVPDLCKLDVETHEAEVLEGFGDVDLRQTVFLVEVLSEGAAQRLQVFFDPQENFFLNIDDTRGIGFPQGRLSASAGYNFLIIPRALIRNLAQGTRRLQRVANQFDHS